MYFLYLFFQVRVELIITIIYYTKYYKILCLSYGIVATLFRLWIRTETGFKNYASDSFFAVAAASFSPVAAPAFWLAAVEVSVAFS